ncbi:MAG: DNA mismatch repair protein MutS [Alphaproteobacteria bacterium]
MTEPEKNTAETTSKTPLKIPAKTTPAMEQYFRIKDDNPDCLLFFRMGDFYELFFEDAVVAAAALNITLTKRGKQEGDDIPMCGVPFHAADIYLARLIRQGFRVAICDQMESPAEAKKRGYKSVVKRDVVRIVTPGTLTEDNLLAPEANNYLAAVATVNAKLGCAWIDLSTGAFSVKLLEPQLLEETLSRLNPKEIIAPDTSIAELGLNDWGRVVTPQPSGRFDSRSAEKRLLETFKLASLDSLGDFDRAEVAAAGAILAYLELTQKTEVPNLRSLTQERDGKIMGIDAATRRNLELVIGPENSRKGSLLACIDKTVSAPGARELSARVAAPLVDCNLIRQRQDQVRTFVERDHMREDLRSLLKQAPDLDRAVQRLLLDRGGPRDLQAVKIGLGLSDEIRTMVMAKPEEQDNQVLTDLIAGLKHSGHCQMALEAALQDELPLLARDGNLIKTGYTAELDELRVLRDEGRRLIANLQADYEKETGVSGLKIKHNKVLGYFVEVKAQHADMVPSGVSDKFIHRQTMSNMVRYATTELADLERKITSAGDRALTLELELFEKLRLQVLDDLANLTTIANALAVLDVTTAMADLALERDWCCPVVEQGTHFNVVGGRHPVVEQAVRSDGQSFVANACTLDEKDRLWLLTGPNMAGKSTFLRQNALIGILAHIGAYVPADSAEIGLIDRVFSRVGAADDLARGRSTFMVEMVETATILAQSTAHSLVILDEIGRGTSTFDGLSIAWATVEQLHEVNKCRTLFATHYHELTELKNMLPALSCHSMKVKEWQDDIIFLHEVGAGAANRSYGIHVAKLAGLPQTVVARAMDILAVLEKEPDANSAEVSDSKSRLSALGDLPLFSPETLSKTQSKSFTPTVKPSVVEEELRNLNPDSLSPRDALEILYKLKEQAHDG